MLRFDQNRLVPDFYLEIPRSVEYNKKVPMEPSAVNKVHLRNSILALCLTHPPYKAHATRAHKCKLVSTLRMEMKS